jgi:hypothetical protein
MRKRSVAGGRFHGRNHTADAFVKKRSEKWTGCRFQVSSASSTHFRLTSTPGNFAIAEGSMRNEGRIFRAQDNAWFNLDLAVRILKQSEFLLWSTLAGDPA